MKIGIIQQHNVADVETNMSHLATKIRQLAQEGAELIVMQELHNSLYFCKEEDVNLFDLAESIPGPSTQFFSNLAKPQHSRSAREGRYHSREIPQDAHPRRPRLLREVLLYAWRPGIQAHPNLCR